MDLATLIGFLASTATIILSIYLGGSSSDFLNSPSALIVVMGTLSVTLIKFPLSKFVLAFGIAGKAFVHKELSSQELMDEIMALAKTLKKKGPLALEQEKISNPFLEKGVRLIVDGFKPEVIRQVLEKEITLTLEQQGIGRNLFKSIGAVAPAMGMIGTLVGLVQMLAQMDDPSKLGPAMAIALLTTLYGAVLAHAFALPIADKLAYRMREEMAQRQLIIEGIVAMQSGVNVIMLEELLDSHMVKSDKGLRSA
jgi:chemotaxis protein MotA